MKARCPNCERGLSLAASLGLRSSLRCGHCATPLRREGEWVSAVWNGVLTIGGSALILAFFTAGRIAAIATLVVVALATVVALWIAQSMNPYGRAD